MSECEIYNCCEAALLEETVCEEHLQASSGNSELLAVEATMETCSKCHDMMTKEKVAVCSHCKEESPRSPAGYTADEFERELFSLINSFASNGLSKTDLVRKMEWVLGSCKVS